MPELLSVRAFAERAGCDEKQVRRAVLSGALRKTDDGLLDATQLDLSWRKVNRRTIAKMSAPVADSADKPEVSEPAFELHEGETPADAAARIVQAGKHLNLAGAVALKENYLGRLKQLEYDQKSGAVVLVAGVARIVGGEYAKVRSRLLAIPAERAPQLHRLRTVAEMEDALRGLITEALQELTQDGAAA